MVEELLRVIYTLVKEISHQKPPNLPSFWPLTPERKVRLTCAWSHFVRLIEFYLLEPFGKLANMNRIYNKPKTSKLWICPFILLLMKQIQISSKIFSMFETRFRHVHGLLQAKNLNFHHSYRLVMLTFPVETQKVVRDKSDPVHSSALKYIFLPKYILLKNSRFI